MPKTKVSITIETAILDRIDRMSHGSSRSEIIEAALKRWLRERQRRELEDAIAAYYSELRDDDLAEDREWADLSARRMRTTWK